MWISGNYLNVLESLSPELVKLILSNYDWWEFYSSSSSENPNEQSHISFFSVGK